MNHKIIENGGFRAMELVADAALSPGHVLERTATGCKKQATSVGFGELLVAQEDALQGKTTADAYSAADMVQIARPYPGTLFRAMLSTGTNYTIGTQLFFAGDGTLRATTGTPKQLVAICEQAIDLSGSNAVATLALVRAA